MTGGFSFMEDLATTLLIDGAETPSSIKQLSGVRILPPL